MVDHESLSKAVHSLARAARVIERAADGLSFADFRAMAAIAEGEERASRLAARLAVGKPAISATIDSLHRRGLVRREAVAGDARATALSLTEAGQELFDRTEARMAEQLAAVVARTDDPDGVVRALGALGPAIEQGVQEHRAQAATQAQAAAHAPAQPQTQTQTTGADA
jgi:DNA-binding MarR family transcriptional regulator